MGAGQEGTPELWGINVIVDIDAGELRYVKEQALMTDRYIEKPIDLESLALIVSQIDHFTLGLFEARSGRI